jgi:outer membrane lipoprotein-sorting protein
MHLHPWSVAVAALLASLSLQAQQPGGSPVIWQKFQDKFGPVQDYAVTMVSQSGGNSFSSRVYRLATRTRMEMEAQGMGGMAMISDPEAPNDKGGKGVAYSLFLTQKMYMKMALTPTTGGNGQTDADVSVEELGKETVAGLVCDKRRMTITEVASKAKHVVLLWTSSSVRNMPVQIESAEQGTTTVIQFRDYDFAKPAATLFVVPADFTPMGGFPGMMPGGMPVRTPTAAPAPGVTVGAPSVSVGTPGVSVATPAVGVSVQPSPAAPVTNTAPQTMEDAVKQGVKDGTQNAVQEGVNRGLKKVFGW